MRVWSLWAFLAVAATAGACKREPPAGAAPPTGSGAPVGAPAPAQGGAAQGGAAGATGTVAGAAGGGTAPPSASVEPAAPAENFRQTAQYLPQGAAMGAWTQSGAVRLFTGGTELFQAIDGAGEKYMAYGFRQMARTDYRRPGSELVVTAEVYDMGSALGAFGQYSMLLSDGRDPSTLESQAQNVGGGGFLGTSQLVFWRGKYLVQLNLADDAGEQEEAALRTAAREALVPLAARIAQSLPGETTRPPAPPGFPADELVWGGVTYLANNGLGVDNTGPAWVGHSRNAAGRRYRVALFARDGVAQARALVTTLRGNLGAAVPALGDEAFWLTHASAGDLLVVRKGARVWAFADPAGEATNALDREGRVARARTLLAAAP